MDVVDTFNHLIPSDQLDDSMLIGQNLECEASNDFGTGVDQLGDSLRNMLSDKDPMFGSASSHFNILDNEDANFQIAEATVVADVDVGATEGILGTAGGGLAGTETPPVKRSVGRPRKYALGVTPERSAGRGSSNNKKPPGKPGRPRKKSILSEKITTADELRRELHLGGGRVNINDLDLGSSMNPVVVLQRLTVTFGGFKIELLPGPSFTAFTSAENTDECYEDGSLYGEGMEYTMVQEEPLHIQNPTAGSGGGVGAAQLFVKYCADDLPLGLGPYVNPNDVQASNGALPGSPCLVETKLDDQSDSQKHDPAEVRKDAGIKKAAQQHLPNSKVPTTNNPAKKQQPKLKLSALSSAKNKHLLAGKGPKGTQQHALGKKLHQRGNMHKMDEMKAKQVIVSLKRRGEFNPAQPGPKIQRTQDGRPVKLKQRLPDVGRGGPVKKTLPSGKRPPGMSPGTTITSKPSNSHVADTQPQPQFGWTPCKRANPQKETSEEEKEEEQDEPKVKKPDKCLQKQRSRNVSRSISVEEPQLFIPDNAPAVVKKETSEEEQAKESGKGPEKEPANSETVVWDPNKNCGLCNKPHSNKFMVGCGHCDDWFHGDCVGLDLAKVKQMEGGDQEYVCLQCCTKDQYTTTKEPGGAVQGEARAEGQQKPSETQDNKMAAKQKQPSPHPVTFGGVRPFRKDSVERRQSTEVKDSTPKSGVSVKQETKRPKVSSPSSKKPVSVDQIRRSVRDALKDILLKRLKESDFQASPEKAAEVAKKTERELFAFYRDTDCKYKSKYRSLMFNLKDTKNNVLFKRVLKGEISPGTLIRMSPEELASKELAAWRQRENRHAIEMIEKEQREAERRPITKITHKGEIEIESQESGKAPEAIEPEPEPVAASKVTEEPVEVPQEKTLSTTTESVNIFQDTTSLHKNHLFDLNCKICTGRMAPPVEEAPTKVVKVATSVVRRRSATSTTETVNKNTQSTTSSTTEGQTTNTPSATTTSTEGETPSSSAKDDDLHLKVLEESLLSAKTFSNYKGRSVSMSGRDGEASFLSNLQPLWRGLVNMPAVAKLLTKAFPVSGVLDHLTEDLPESFQMGGRISPQIVWDYLDKIRATGTKEVCLIRFSPETDEDEIHYTLLYAYFSSRKRFGVVANNLKQVKDMYLIPLGAIEKVPHQLVPFDGPGLENNRPNLLLGLIIRQRPKRDFLPVDINETARFIPESKPETETTTVTVNNKEVTREEENSYISSLCASSTKERDREEIPLLNTAEEEVVTAEQSSTDISEKAEGEDTEEGYQPLRFLPGVLRSWGGELLPLPDFSGNPPLLGDDGREPSAPQTSKANGGAATTPGSSTTTKSPSAGAHRQTGFVIKKREPKTVKAEEPVSSSLAETSTVNNNVLAKEEGVAYRGPSVSLKDKPPDVSTESFLASLSTDPNTDGSLNKGDSALCEKDKSKEEKTPTLLSPTATSNASVEESVPTPKPLPSGILKKSSAYSNMTEEPTAVQSAGSQDHPQPVPVLTTRKYRPMAAQHGYPSHHHQTGYRRPPPDHGPLQVGPYGPIPLQPGGPPVDYQYQPAPPVPPFGNTAPPPFQHPPQLHTNFSYPTGPPPPMMYPPPHDPQMHNHAGITQWAQPGPGPTSPNSFPGGLPLAYGGDPQRFASDSSNPNLPPSAAAKEDQKGAAERILYSSPWDRQPGSGHKKEDRDQYGRHRHHSESRHGEKSRNHSQEGGRKRDRSRSRERDRSKDSSHHRGSRHHSKDERHGHSERRKERHHSDGDHGNRHKHSRRDSDYEKSRRSSKDSHS
uniref:PHD finger protein 3 isoform X1 n=1 Tax=Oncorhynchus gorbuscha TaxID=8017 RepID=UPI001EAF842E|nr:PHD finger protein 3 isoform X1 [Oncorhynchus gorbuscha]XP_046191442.1 PHD finger protein 3 isoform X1 [Oncorhynchus gorbuscha]